MKLPRVQFTVRQVMLVAFACAVVLAMYLPELRNFDQAARENLIVAAFLTALFCLCYLPCWIVLFFRRKRKKLGMRLGRHDNANLVGSVVLSFITLISAILPLMR